MAKKMLVGDEAKRALEKGVNALVNIVKTTLGPKGRNVVVSRKFTSPLITNDGVTIAREVDLEDKFENIGAQIIKEVCTKTNDYAGDGTTTASVLAQAIVTEGIRNITAGANPMILRRGITKAIDTVVGTLKANSRQIESLESIRQVAAVSADDESVGEIIAKAIEVVGKDGIVTIEESKTMQTELKAAKGMQFDKGYCSSYMSTDMEKMEAVIENPYIFITDKRLSNASEIICIMEHVAAKNGKLLIIAEDVDGEALATLLVNKMRGVFVGVAVKAPSFGQKRQEILQDIATFTGGQFFASELGFSLDNLSIEQFGVAKNVVISKDKTIIIEGNADPGQLAQRVDAIKTRIENETSQYEIEILKSRLARLGAGVAVISVGAMTEIEMKERKLRIEDALNATRAAIDEGIVAGGGTALIKCMGTLKKQLNAFTGDEKIGAKIVYDALTSPLRQIVINAGYEAGVIVEKIKNHKNINYGFDAMTGKFCDMIGSGIIDPVKVTRSALQNAGSVAGTLLTTESLVVETDEVTAR